MTVPAASSRRVPAGSRGHDSAGSPGHDSAAFHSRASVDSRADDSAGSPGRASAGSRRHTHAVRPTLDLERELAASGYDFLVGFDEVGRGALAGPVMVGAAAIATSDLAKRQVPEGVADSKLLTAHRREGMLDALCSWCTAYAVGQATNTEIDEWGISHALGIAALRALNNIEQHLAVVAPYRIGAILDGPNDYITKALDTFDAPLLAIPAEIITRVKADQQCASVATASVIAKVTRDRLMVSIAQGNPAYRPYHWAQNKGYGSAEHRAAIARYGATDLHRRSWHLV